MEPWLLSSSLFLLWRWDLRHQGLQVAFSTKLDAGRMSYQHTVPCSSYIAIVFTRLLNFAGCKALGVRL